ncbi:murein biosynthesis integral membrane protein MurJ [Aggregatilinea lenta]|uniref:murein biosynthesis integral membrane protein MurJ n=1 Tax=Aggregatilinea lenta TaxID=913108 RepID=UPI0013C2D7A4|nr:murein biosynthesis integral membrane protein MurJ [Aggregatilinea lenta]
MLEENVDAAMTDAAAAAPLHDSVPLDAPSSGMVRATTVIALGNITSRVLGLVRETIISALFGAGAAVDALNLALVVPRGLYDLLIGGHVNSALVPVLSEYAQRKDRDELWRLVNILLGLVVISLSVLVLALELLAPVVIRVVASDKTAPEVIDEATRLLRVTAPALMALSLFAVLSGVLYALRRFTWPAFASTVFNGTIVVTTLALAGRLDITAAAVGWLVGAVVQMLLQAPGLRDARLRISVRGALSHPGVRRIGVLYVPVMATLALDVLVNRPFSYNLATRTGEGSLAYMNWATTLIQFPQGLVAIAISSAILPTLSRQAAVIGTGARQQFRNTLGQGLRLAIVLIIPAAVGLFVLAGPVVGLIFQHGKFLAGDTTTTALALRLYLLGLPFAAVDLLLVYAFYAQQDTLTPALIGLVSLGAYMVVAIVLLPWYSFFALMIADSVKHLIHSAISARLLWHKLDGYGRQHLLRTVVRASFAAAIMGGAALAISLGLEQFLPGSVIGFALTVGVAGGAGLVIYSLLASRLGLEEWSFVRGLLRRFGL